VNILSVSDIIVPIIYNPNCNVKFEKTDFIIACGDLPYYYQEFIISALNKPLFFVRGNHDPELEYGQNASYSQPRGGIDLHKRAVRYKGILMAGIEGSIKYKKEGFFQYTQTQMWFNVFSLIPALLLNRIKYNRYLDIFITHAPPWKIHDADDLPHQGIKAFRWFIETFQPRYHFHGHIHIYRPDTIRKTILGRTEILNTYGYLETEFQSA
jgi:Icc-related predicted phosphoesterase